jgi:hypothetical protein
MLQFLTKQKTNLKKAINQFEFILSCQPEIRGITENSFEL